MLQYLTTYFTLLPNTTQRHRTVTQNTGLNTVECSTRHFSNHVVVAWSKSLQLTSVASCYTEYRSGYLIVRPRIHPPVQSSTPDLYFQSATCHGSVILLHFTSLRSPFSQCSFSVRPQTHLTHSDAGFSIRRQHPGCRRHKAVGTLYPVWNKWRRKASGQIHWCPNRYYSS